MECRVEEKRHDVQAEGRESGPGERLVPRDHVLLPARPEESRACREAEPHGEGQDAEGDEARGSGHIPGDGRVREEGVHALTRRRNPGSSSDRVPSSNGVASVGTTRAASWGLAASRARIVGTRDRERGRVGLGLARVRAGDRHRQWAGRCRRARLRVDQMVERSVGSEAATVAAGGSDPAAVEREGAELSAGAAGVGDGHPPGPPVGGRPADRDVASQVDETAGHLRPCRLHRSERAHRREPLTDAAEIDRGAVLHARSTGVDIYLDGRACPPALDGARRTRHEIGERPVVAGGDESRQDGWVEPSHRSPRAGGPPLRGHRRAAHPRPPTTRRRR